MTLHLIFRLAAVATACSLAIWLIACDSEQTTPELREGVLHAGGPVSGVKFETASQAGVTGPEGQFSYLDEEAVSFRLGDTFLGSTSGRPLVTPFDLAGTEPPAPLRPFQGHIGFQDWTYDRESPLHQAVNVIVMLQTLDRDGDPRTDVTITSEVAELFEGVSIDFSPPEVISEAERAITIFRRNRAFRSVLQRANERGLFEIRRVPVEPAAALQALYESLELEPPGFVVVHEDNTQRTDEAIPLIARSLDSQGLVERVEQDTDGDGSFDVVMRAQRNDRRHLTRVSYDLDGDDVDDVTESIDREYSRDGDPFVVETTREGWANVAPRSVVTNEYDALGAVLRTTRDDDGDGELERESTAEYDNQGNLVRAASDYDGDGTLDRAVTRVFSEDGQLLEETVFSSPLSGTRSTYDYDDAGRLTDVLSVDASTNATVREETREYDAAGNLVRLHWNRGPGSSVSTTETLDYDDAGRPLWREVYHGGSNRTDRETWRYDDHGNVTRYVEDRSNDGEPDRIVETEFRDDGRLTTKKTTEHGCVGRDLVTTVERWTYDEEGRQTRYEVGFEDFEPYEEESWTYGDDERLLLREGRNVFGTWTFDYESNEYSQSVSKRVPPGVVPCFVPTDDQEAPLGVSQTGTSILELRPATWWHILGSETGQVNFQEWLPIPESSGNPVEGL